MKPCNVSFDSAGTANSDFGSGPPASSPAADLVSQARPVVQRVKLSASNEARQAALQELARLPAKQQREILRQSKLLRIQRAHERRFDQWRDQLRLYCQAERGRTSELARALGVRRQSAWRWINQSWSKFPAWAAVAAIVWYFRQVPSQAVAVSGEAIGPALLVSPQADNLSADPRTKEGK
jgi:hypothetical protein